MLKLFLIPLSVFLISIVFIRVPIESTGIKAQRSTEKALNNLTAFGVFLYVSLAIVANTIGS